MKQESRFMMRCIVSLALAAAVVWPVVAPAEDVTTVAGSVTWVSTDVVEVAGRRGLIVSESSISSDGHAVSLAAIHVGMPAEMEIDPSGVALEVRVKGAVE